MSLDFVTYIGAHLRCDSDKRTKSKGDLHQEIKENLSYAEGFQNASFDLWFPNRITTDSGLRFDAHGGVLYKVILSEDVPQQIAHFCLEFEKEIETLKKAYDGNVIIAWGVISDIY